MEDNTKQINNSIASGRSDSTEVTEKDSLPDVQIKKPELISLKCRNLEKIYSDIFENDSEVQPSVSKSKNPKVEEAKQIFSDVSPDDCTRERVLSDLTDELLVAANWRSLNLLPVSLFSSDDELLSSFSDRSTTESSEVSKPKSYTSVLEKLLEFEEISMEIRNPSSQTGKHLPPIPLCLQEGVPIREIESFMSPTKIGSDENIIENINVPPISENLKNAEGQESLCVPVNVLDIETVIHNDSVGSDVVGPEKSTTRQPRPKRRFLSALLKVGRSLCCWRC